jgi:hypothetical protein
MKDWDEVLGIIGIGWRFVLLEIRSLTEGTGASVGTSIWFEITEAGSTGGAWINGTGFPA